MRGHQAVMVQHYLLWLLPSLSWSPHQVKGFQPPFHRWRCQPSRTVLLADQASNDHGDEEFLAMKKMLESSWDATKMGKVPMDATEAADEAFSSILSATDQGVDVMLIDLFLPSYDITQGSNLYDEVKGVEYCIALAEKLKGRTSILVRDGKTLGTVKRILDAREKLELEEAQEEEIADIDSDEEDGMDQEEGDVSTSQQDPKDFDPSSKFDRNSFREQLMESWEADDGTDDTRKNDVSNSAANKQSSTQSNKRYRLGSLFGNAIVSDSADMMESVGQALRVFALPKDDEENIIILSAYSRAEMVGVRTLVAKYEGKKKLILVNCKLDPIPMELTRAQTVYSILPLVMKLRQQPVAEVADEKTPARVVVLRRFPNDWEVFVDVGDGFQLADTAPAKMSNKRGPPTEWVGKRVQQYLANVL